MKILTYLLLAMMAGLTGMDRITSRVQTKEYIDEHMNLARIDTSETSYTVNLLDVDSSSKYFHDIMPVLDTLVKNHIAEMYIWKILYRNDSLITQIRDWCLRNFKDSRLNEMKSGVFLHGAFRYSRGNDSKIFLVITSEETERENEFLNKLFPVTDGLLEVEIEYVILPPNTFALYPDVTTFFQFFFADNHICDDYLLLSYNSGPVTLKLDSANELTVIHSDGPKKRRRPFSNLNPWIRTFAIPARQTDSLSK